MNSAAKSTSTARTFLSAAATLGLLACTAAFLIGLVFQDDWRGDALTHFIPYYGVGCLLAVVLIHWRWLRIGAAAALFAICIYIAASPVALPPQTGGANAAESPWHSFSVLAFNVNWANRDGTAFESYVERVKPDVMVFLEVSPAWLEMLRGLAERHGYAVQGTAEFGLYSSAILSKFPLTEALFFNRGQEAPKLQAAIDVHGTPVRIGGVHLSQPLIAVTNQLQRKEAQQLAWYFKRSDLPTIMIGDFNSTPWSFINRRLYTKTGLKTDIRLLSGSWPSWSFIRLPIDNIFVSAHVAIRDLRVVREALGSDHLPILATLAIKPATDSSSSR